MRHTAVIACAATALLAATVAIATGGGPLFSVTAHIPDQSSGPQHPEHAPVGTDTTQNGNGVTRETRAERRAGRAALFAARLDSLAESRSFEFYPVSMQSSPRGMLRTIYASFYRLRLSPDGMEVYLPVERGMTQYVSMLDFDADAVENYSATKDMSQWNVSFSATAGEERYDFDMIIDTVTGETLLSVTGTDTAMRYIGTLDRPETAADNRGKSRRRN